MSPHLLASGSITNPYVKLGINSFLSFSPANQPGLPLFVLLGNFFKLVVVFAGLYGFWNLLMAGYQYMSAGGDPKKVSQASEKIWQTLLGLVVATGAVTIAAIIGYIVFKDPTFLITPRIVVPQ